MTRPRSLFWRGCIAGIDCPPGTARYQYRWWYVRHSRSVWKFRKLNKFRGNWTLILSGFEMSYGLWNPFLVLFTRTRQWSPKDIAYLLAVPEKPLFPAIIYTQIFILESGSNRTRLTQVVVSTRPRHQTSEVGRAGIARARRRGLLAKFGGRGGVRRRVQECNLAARVGVRGVGGRVHTWRRGELHLPLRRPAQFQLRIAHCGDSLLLFFAHWQNRPAYWPRAREEQSFFQWDISIKRLTSSRTGTGPRRQSNPTRPDSQQRTRASVTPARSARGTCLACDNRWRSDSRARPCHLQLGPVARPAHTSLAASPRAAINIPEASAALAAWAVPARGAAAGAHAVAPPCMPPTMRHHCRPPHPDGPPHPRSRTARLPLADVPAVVGGAASPPPMRRGVPPKAAKACGAASSSHRTVRTATRPCRRSRRIASARAPARP